MEAGIPVITVTDKLIEIRKIPDVDIDAQALNEALLTLPAKTYLSLYHKMQEKVIGYPYYAGCCVPATIEDDPEDNAKYYSEQPKLSKSYSVGE